MYNIYYNDFSLYKKLKIVFSGKFYHTSKKEFIPIGVSY